MGKPLYDSQPVFRDALDRCAAIFDTLLNRPLLEVLFAPEASPEADLLNQTGYTQPALFSFEYALSELWLSWGIRPDVVMGHSVGEIAAMCVAGGITLLCQSQVRANAGPGDSGSPVFSVDDAAGNGTLFGVLWGGEDIAGVTHFWFSPFAAVQAELGF